MVEDCQRLTRYRHVQFPAISLDTSDIVRPHCDDVEICRRSLRGCANTWAANGNAGPSGAPELMRLSAPDLERLEGSNTSSLSLEEDGLCENFTRSVAPNLIVMAQMTVGQSDGSSEVADL